MCQDNIANDSFVIGDNIEDYFDACKLVIEEKEWYEKSNYGDRFKFWIVDEEEA
jgi:hypothetical protein